VAADKPSTESPFAFFLPLLLGGIITAIVARALRPTFGVLAIHWIVLLFVGCTVFATLFLGLVGYVLKYWNNRRSGRNGEFDSRAN
jgi:hypothetical protein